MHNTSILSNVLHLEEVTSKTKYILLFGKIGNLKRSAQFKLIFYKINCLEPNRTSSPTYILLNSKYFIWKLYLYVVFSEISLFIPSFK